MIKDNIFAGEYDRVVIGAGIFGLYAAINMAKRGLKVAVIEKNNKVFKEASLVNQARIHSGYHYPRSLSTALQTIEYKDRFVDEFAFAVDKNLKQIYAIAKNFSYTNSLEYEKFCSTANLRCDQIDVSDYFNEAYIEAAYLTDEYVFDAKKMADYLFEKVNNFANIDVFLSAEINDVIKSEDDFLISFEQSEQKNFSIKTSFVLNSTYAGLNKVLAKFEYSVLPLKYEFAELSLCKVTEKLRGVGLTVMDGPFFSLMPYGRTGLHSLSSVTYTPHKSGYDHSSIYSENPQTKFIEMKQMSKKYLSEDIDFDYVESIYATKVILAKSESDDARPTVLIEASTKPYFASVLSGKLNTIFDLESLCKI